jgi:hypothetical protein
MNNMKNTSEKNDIEKNEFKNIIEKITVSKNKHEKNSEMCLTYVNKIKMELVDKNKNIEFLNEQLLEGVEGKNSNLIISELKELLHDCTEKLKIGSDLNSHYEFLKNKGDLFE